MIYKEEPFYTLFFSLEKKIKNDEQTAVKNDETKKKLPQINYFFLDQLFNDLFDEFDCEENIKQYSYVFEMAKKAIEYYQNINYLFLLFYQLSKNLMIPYERGKIILNLLKKWKNTTFPLENKIYKYQNPSFQDLCDEAHILWFDAITKNMQLKRELNELTTQSLNSLSDRADRSKALVRGAFKMGNRKDEDNNERRYMKFASDLIYTIDSMNSDIEKDYEMPVWED